MGPLIQMTKHMAGQYSNRGPWYLTLPPPPLQNFYIHVGPTNWGKPFSYSMCSRFIYDIHCIYLYLHQHHALEYQFTSVQSACLEHSVHSILYLDNQESVHICFRFPYFEAFSFIPYRYSTISRSYPFQDCQWFKVNEFTSISDVHASHRITFDNILLLYN